MKINAHLELSDDAASIVQVTKRMSKAFMRFQPTCTPSCCSVPGTRSALTAFVRTLEIAAGYVVDNLLITNIR